MNYIKFLVGLVLSIMAGVISGLLGGGGGMLVVPLLIFCFGFSQKEANANAILVILSSCLAASFNYFNAIKSNLNIVLLVGSGAILGGIIGAVLLKKLNNNLIKKMFALVMLVAGIMMIVKGLV